ncbi:MAG: hypothetical protein U0414_43640 [Polyangiaceae bacterium]
MRPPPLASVASTAALVLGLSACNTDAAVFVDPDIEDPAVTVTKAALGTTLTGSVTLTLHLSARASGPSSVTLGSFALKKSDGTTVLVENLPYSADPASPVAVAEDSTTTVKLTFDSGAKLLDAAVRDAVCAGDVVVAGVIEDSLLTTSTPVVSDPFTPSCP